MKALSVLVRRNMAYLTDNLVQQYMTDGVWYMAFGTWYMLELLHGYIVHSTKYLHYQWPSFGFDVLGWTDPF